MQSPFSLINASKYSSNNEKLQEQFAKKLEKTRWVDLIITYE